MECRASTPQLLRTFSDQAYAFLGQGDKRDSVEKSLSASVVDELHRDDGSPMTLMLNTIEQRWGCTPSLGNLKNKPV